MLSAPVVRDNDDLFQRDTREVLKLLFDYPILQGVLLEDVAITTSATRVAHNLGREARGFWMVDATVDTRLHRDPTAAPSTSAITLIATANATVSLWVF